jgi:hypothetical protein
MVNGGHSREARSIASHHANGERAWRGSPVPASARWIIVFSSAFLCREREKALPFEFRIVLTPTLGNGAATPLIHLLVAEHVFLNGSHE